MIGKIEKIYSKCEKYIFTFMLVVTLLFGVFVFIFKVVLNDAEEIINIIENSDKYDFYTTCIEIKDGYACINESEVIENDKKD